MSPTRTGNNGDLANARRIVYAVEHSLMITGDKKVFAGANPQLVEELARDLQRAFVAAQNLARVFGEVDFRLPPDQAVRSPVVFVEVSDNGYPSEDNSKFVDNAGPDSSGAREVP